MVKKQGIVDGSASQPVLVQDTNYMVEKTYLIAPYLGAFGASVTHIWFKRCFHIVSRLLEPHTLRGRSRVSLGKSGYKKNTGLSVGPGVSPTL